MDYPQTKVIPKSQSKWRLSINGGYGLVGKSIISATNEKEAFARGATEDPVDVFSSNISLSYDLSRNFSISSGLSYQKVYEKFSWSGTYYEDFNGDSFNNVENITSIVYEKVERQALTYNQYNYLDIPLYISFRPQLNNKLRTALFAGLSANVFNTNKGTVLNQLAIPIELSTASNDIQIGLRYALGVSLELPISEYFGLQLNGLYSIRNNTQRDLTLRYDYLEINLGLSYRFH